MERPCRWNVVVDYVFAAFMNRASRCSPSAASYFARPACCASKKSLRQREGRRYCVNGAACTRGAGKYTDYLGAQAHVVPACELCVTTAGLHTLAALPVYPVMCQRCGRGRETTWGHYRVQRGTSRMVLVFCIRSLVWSRETRVSPVVVMVYSLSQALVAD